MNTIGSGNILNRVFYNELGVNEIRELQTKTIQGGPSYIVNISNLAKELQVQTKNTKDTIDSIIAQQEQFRAASEDYRALLRYQQNSIR